MCVKLCHLKYVGCRNIRGPPGDSVPSRSHTLLIRNLADQPSARNQLVGKISKRELPGQ